MWGWLTAIVQGLGTALFGAIQGWLTQQDVKMGEQTKVRLADAEAARAKEQEVQRVSDTLRDDPGPVLDLSGLRDRPGRRPDPPA